MRVDVLGSDAPAWDEALSGAERDVYHSAGYHRFAQGRGEGSPRLLLVQDGSCGLAWPYLLRKIGDLPEFAGADDTEVTSVYGYPGPVAWDCHASDPFLEQAWSAAVDVWRSERAVAVFTRFNPLLGNAELAATFSVDSALDDHSLGVVAEGPTVSVDCTIDDDAASSAYARPLRQHIAAARRAGLTTTEDREWAEIETFARLYGATMERNAAADYYLMAEQDFWQLRAALPGHVHLLVVRCGADVAAAGLFLEWTGIVQAHLLASNDAFRHLSPAKLLLDDARRWARARGERVLHLGGGRGAREDSLFFFKREFSGRRHVFSTGRWVLDRPRYAELVAQHVRATGGDTPDTFFPRYRSAAI